MSAKVVLVASSALVAVVCGIIWLAGPGSTGDANDKPDMWRLPSKAVHSPGETAAPHDGAAEATPVLKEVANFKHPNEWIKWGSELGSRLYTLKDPAAAMAALKKAGESMRHTDRRRMWHGFLKNFTESEDLEGHYTKFRSVHSLLEQVTGGELVGYPGAPAFNMLMESLAFSSKGPGRDSLEARFAQQPPADSYEKMWQKAAVAVRLAQEPASGITKLGGIADLEVRGYAEASVLRNLALTDDVAAMNYFLSDKSVAEPTESLVNDIAGQAAGEGYSALAGSLENAGPSPRKDAVIRCLLQSTPRLPDGDLEHLLQMSSTAEVRAGLDKAYRQRFAAP